MGWCQKTSHAGGGALSTRFRSHLARSVGSCSAISRGQEKAFGTLIVLRRRGDNHPHSLAHCHSICDPLYINFNPGQPNTTSSLVNTSTCVAGKTELSVSPIIVGESQEVDSDLRSNSVFRPGEELSASDEREREKEKESVGLPHPHFPSIIFAVFMSGLVYLHITTERSIAGMSLVLLQASGE